MTFIALHGAQKPASGGSTLPDDLVLYLKQDEASGNAVSAVGSNIFMAYNAPGSDAGQVGNARTYDKDSNQWHGLVSPNGLAFGTGDFTISFWVQISGLFNYNTILNWGNQSSTNPYIWILFNSNTLIVQFVDGQSDYNSMNTGVSITDDTWTEFTLVFDRDDNLTTYKNGAAAAVNNISGHQGNFTSAAGMGLASYYGDPSLALDGRLDEFKIWHRGLTPDEVLENNTNGAGGNPLPL